MNLPMPAGPASRLISFVQTLRNIVVLMIAVVILITLFQASPDHTHATSVIHAAYDWLKAAFKI